MPPPGASTHSDIDRLLRVVEAQAGIIQTSQNQFGEAVSKMTSALETVARIDERQIEHGKALDRAFGGIEANRTKISHVDEHTKKWLNRLWGCVILMPGLWALGVHFRWF